MIRSDAPVADRIDARAQLAALPSEDEVSAPDLLAENGDAEVAAVPAARPAEGRA